MRRLGCGMNNYYIRNVIADIGIHNDNDIHHAEMLNAPDYLATQVSYKFGLRGPSIGIYTACSTSLVAVCMGCDSLLSYQSDMVLAGGVTIFCPQEKGYLYQEGEIFSQDGHTRPFDAQAKGTVFGSGAGAVVLKRVEDAIADGDCIYAVRDKDAETGSNNDRGPYRGVEEARAG